MSEEFTMSMYASKDDLIAAMREKVEKLEAELVKESGRTAEQKLRADQMSKQHDMQCKMSKQHDMQCKMNKQAYAEAEDAKRRASRAGVEMYAAMQGRHA